MSDQPYHAAFQPRTYWPLAGVVLVYIILAAVYGFLTPPFEGPDEPQHFAYVMWLASGKGLPPQGEAAWDTPMEQEAGQTPLYYLVASLPARLFDTAVPAAIYRPNPYFPGPALENKFDNDNRAVHSLAEKQPFQGQWPALYLARLVTLLFGILLVVSVYFLAVQVRPFQPAFAYSAAALVALTPQVLFLSSVVSNDIPAAALGTLALIFLAGLVRRAPQASGAAAFAAGLFTGLAVMAKINALLLLAPGAMTLLWLWLGAKRPLKNVAIIALWMGGGFLLVSGWWFMRGTRLYGSPLGVGTHDYAPWVISDPQSLASPLARWLEVGRFYWLTLGWGTIRPPAWVYGMFFLLAGLALVGLALAVYRRWKRQGLYPGPDLAILIVLAVTLLANVLLLEVWMNRVIAPYGRLLFTSIAPIMIFLILGWQAIQPRFVLVPLIFLAVAAVLTPFYLLRPAFIPPLLSAEAVAALPPSLGWRFGDTAAAPLVELISVQPRQDSIEIGDTLSVQLCWQALKETAREYVVFAQLVGPQDSRVAERRSYPGEGLLPSSQWQAGDLFCDDFFLHVDAAWAPTLVYNLEVGMFDEETGKRLAAVGAQGDRLESTFVDRVRVSGASETVAVEDAGGGPVQLIAQERDPDPWRPGESYAYELDWAATAPLEMDYQVFLHLRDRVSGEVVAQADHAPLDGWYPTSWWPVGQIIRDAGRFALPADTPGGTYDLVAGFYNLASLQPLSEEFVLGTVQVRP
jgi:4-amino-4-deoxy-L-arabinose transferase-like glycosyltransferase